MGLYINSRNDTSATSKWETISAIGEEVSARAFADHAPGADGKVGVCLLHNGSFVAAGVAYSVNEARVFADVRDGRQRKYMLLTRAQIEELDPNVEAELKRLFKDKVS